MADNKKSTPKKQGPTPSKPRDPKPDPKLRVTVGELKEKYRGTRKGE
jgi:hypothetical protein